MRLARALLCLCLACLVGPAAGTTGVRVVVDTADLTVTVYEADHVLARFENIAIGRGGAAPDRQHRDHKTPLGEFRIARVKHDSDYHLFLGFDFPTPDHANRALEQGRISAHDYREIARAAREARLPPQDTPLGGYLGIHGIGNGDPGVHRRLNWTEGCIALTNEQVDRLARLVRLGTPVEVR